MSLAGRIETVKRTPTLVVLMIAMRLAGAGPVAAAPPSSTPDAGPDRFEAPVILKRLGKSDGTASESQRPKGDGMRHLQWSWLTRPSAKEPASLVEAALQCAPWTGGNTLLVETKGNAWHHVVAPVRAPAFIKSSRRRFSPVTREKIRTALSTGDDLSGVALELRKVRPDLVVITVRPYVLETRGDVVGISGLPEQFRIRRSHAGWCCSDSKRCWDDAPQ